MIRLHWTVHVDLSDTPGQDGVWIDPCTYLLLGKCRTLVSSAQDVGEMGRDLLYDLGLGFPD